MERLRSRLASTIEARGVREDSVAKRSVEEEENFLNQVRELVIEKKISRFGDLCTELGMKSPGRVVLALNQLRDLGEVVQIGTPKTPSARWASRDHVKGNPDLVKLSPSGDSRPVVPKNLKVVAGPVAPAELGAAKPKKRQKDAPIVEAGPVASNSSDGGAATGPLTASDVSSKAVAPGTAAVDIHNKLGVLAERLWMNLSKIPGDVAFRLCRDVELCYEAANVADLPPWRQPLNHF
jgi:hypothetical protein